jgi:OmcA/MtrC family decaheme c-type cytochrome
MAAHVRHIGPVKSAVAYTPSDAEFYLTPLATDYVRPGYNIKIESLQVPSTTRKPVVELTFTDNLGQSLDRLGKVTPGTLSVSFVLAWYDAANRDYVAYTTRAQKSPITNVTAVQAGTDSGGTWEDISLGRARYTFATALPASYDGSKTHTLGIYGARAINLTDPVTIAKTYYVNLLTDFRPDGGAVKDVWNAVADTTCNSCHDPLGAHGGSRRAIKLCVLCHNTTQSLDPDTGNTVNMKVMIHKIHNGPNLPSVKAGHPYIIIGNAQSTHDFSDVTYPQDVRSCDTCHRADSPEGAIWYTRPSRAACGSCHDDINWVTGDNHTAGPQADDSACASCHRPQGETEFDASIKGAHVVPIESAQLKGLKCTITKVANTAPGQKPVVTFTLSNGDGSAIDPASLARLRFYIVGPNTDFVTSVNENANTSKTTCTGTTCTYSFATAVVPATAKGSWAIAAEVYRTITLNPAPTGTTTVREALNNPMFYFAVTDTTAVPRRQVVDTAKCNKCHNPIAPHGGGRRNAQYCPVCHTPNAVDNQTPPGSWAFKWMVHRIHTGIDLQKPYMIGSTSFGDVGYPGDRRNCEACHNAGTYKLPLADTTLPTQTPNDYVPVWQPDSASCVSCHDSRETAAHAYTMTSPFGEACAACHGPGLDYDVAKVHAR